MDFLSFHNEILEEIKAEENQAQVEGIKKLEEFENSLLNYYAEGHGDETFIKGQVNGFVECLVAVGMVKAENYMVLIETFAEEFKKLKKDRILKNGTITR